MEKQLYGKNLLNGQRKVTSACGKSIHESSCDFSVTCLTFTCVFGGCQYIKILL